MSERKIGEEDPRVNGNKRESRGAHMMIEIKKNDNVTMHVSFAKRKVTMLETAGIGRRLKQMVLHQTLFMKDTLAKKSWILKLL